MGHRRLEEVPGAVQLVVVIEVRPALVRFVDLVGGVDVAIGLLRGSHQRDDLVHHFLDLRIADVGEVEGGGFEPFVDVGVHKDGAAIFALACTGSQSQVVEVAGLFQHPVAVADAHLAVDRLFVEPESAGEGDLADRQRAPARVGAVCCGYVHYCHSFLDRIRASECLGLFRTKNAGDIVVSTTIFQL